jgi:large subunit ribosomal protein L1
MANTKLSKRQQAMHKLTADLGAVELAKAVEVLKSFETALPKGVKPFKFDQSIDLTVRLGIDPKHADQIVRGSIVYPHGIGKSKRVLVFCQGPNVAIAQAAGAEFVGGKDLADKIKEGWTDFDVAIATPDMMGVVGPLGKVLGPRGLMPSPRAGTVTQDVAGAVKEYRAGKIEFRCDDYGIVHVVVGKLSFAPQAIEENTQAMLNLIRSLKPNASKGQYIRSVTISGTMTPGIRINAA